MSLVLHFKMDVKTNCSWAKGLTSFFYFCYFEFFFFLFFIMLC